MAVFLFQPLALGGWLALIPAIKESLGLSKGQLALALIGMPLALIPCLQFAGRVIAALGQRRTIRMIFPVQAAAMCLPLLAWSGPTLFLSLACIGAAMAFIEVAMNAYAGRLEKQTGAMIMNRCHGFWALGLFAGSGVMALMGGEALLPVQMALAFTSAVFGIWVSFQLPPLDGDEVTTAPPRRPIRALPPALIFIGLFMFFSTLTEGAMADWAAVYLAERLDSPGARAGIAVTIFSAFMAGGRFLGDWLKSQLGAVALARLLTSCGIAGLLLLVLPLPLWMAYPGFALVGFGIAVAYPLGVSAIAALDDTYEASNIAIMATVALCGFLVGPPMIGFLSEAFSLSVGLAALLPGLVVALWLTRWLAPESPGIRRSESRSDASDS